MSNNLQVNDPGLSVWGTGTPGSCQRDVYVLALANLPSGNVAIVTYNTASQAIYINAPDVALQIVDNFDYQKRLFLAIPQAERERYHGQFVASRNGVIIDHDADLAELNRRFFGQYGDISVYITGIGKSVKMRTPFITKR